MNRALVVYESMFGNTREIAEAIGTGLAELLDVDVIEVGEADSRVADDVTVMIVGGPTHAFGMSRPKTRQDAADQVDEPVISRDRGIREWMDSLAGAMPPVATFDTKVVRPKLPGSAAKKAMRVLKGRGHTPIADPETFLVDGGHGPVTEGEISRARAWGVALARQVAQATPAVNRGSAGPRDPR
jgi:hypothetical protein